MAAAAEAGGSIFDSGGKGIVKSNYIKTRRGKAMKGLLRSAVLCSCLLVTLPLQAMEKGALGDEVLALQESLAAHGYLAREADGVFGSTTEKALRLFQRDRGLTVTGEPDAATTAALAADGPARRGGGVLFAPGNLGAEVVELQHMLTAAGYASGVADGAYGPALTAAVQAFQRDHELEVIGAVDEATWALLTGVRPEEVSRGFVKGMREERREAVRAKATVKKPATNVKPDTQQGSGYQDTKERIGLKQGAKGKTVRELQSRLIQHGYPVGAVDEHFGAGTERALRAWQEAQGVAVTGIADAYFWEKTASIPPQPKKYKKHWRMHATAYSSEDPGNGTHTARGSRLTRGLIAVDPERIPLGSLVYVVDYGYAVADDIGGAIKGAVIDLGMDTHHEALQWGRRDVEVYLIEEGEG